MGDSLPKPFDKPHNLSRIPRLIHEPSRCGFCEQLAGSLFNLFQYTVKTISKAGQEKRSADVPGQLCASSRLLRISVNRCRGNGFLESIELGFESLNLLLDVFKFLRPLD